MTPTPVEFSPYKWPLQSCPDPTYWKVWRSACRLLTNADKTLKDPLGEWLTSPCQLLHWEISANGQRLYEKRPDHAIVHLCKQFHRNSQRHHREFTLTGQTISLDEIPFNTDFATVKQGANSIKLLSSTTKGAFQTNMRYYNYHIFGENFLQKSLPPESHLHTFLCDINELKHSDICIHIRSAHCEEHMGFCYEQPQLTTKVPQVQGVSS